MKAETGGSSLHSIACQTKPNLVDAKPHWVREAPALNPNGGVAENGHGLVNANCTKVIYITWRNIDL